jgi:hypothetical protein
MRILACLMMIAALSLPALCQTSDEEEQAPKLLGGFLYQTAITQESYLITNPEEMEPFALRIPPVTPYKVLPLPPNPDPFLKGFTVNFEQSVLAVAVGRNRIKNPPVFKGTELLENGERRVHFSLPALTAEGYPLGWAVYTAVILPRIEGTTTVVVTTVPAKKQPKWTDADFPRL